MINGYVKKMAKIGRDNSDFFVNILYDAWNIKFKMNVFVILNISLHWLHLNIPSPVAKYINRVEDFMHKDVDREKENKEIRADGKKA